MTPPVIFLVFNRPDCTRRVFERIRAARPSRLFVVCDGPRAGVAADAGRVAEVRRIVEEGLDWPCEVERDYAAENLGCRRRVASGLTAAFARFDEAIVLEDDTLPDPSFFTFCGELLARFRDDERVLHIAGSNLAAPYLRLRESYWFGRQAPIWGWATWARAWRHYDLELREWEARLPAVQRSFASRWERHYWMPLLEQAHAAPEQVDTWDFAWVFACRARGSFSVIPSAHLVENIGVGAEASHTTQHQPRLQIPAQSLTIATHPAEVAWHRYADEMLTRAYAGETIDGPSNLRSRLRIWRDALLGT